MALATIKGSFGCPFCFVVGKDSAETIIAGVDRVTSAIHRVYTNWCLLDDTFGY